ncbi:smad nuclear-interacting protein 1-like [Paramacrobiotus metropolitanus]|uniref:smad nuclear-interacting protein 1-like n=1 Tax=Paramacrobiotus metropolitanus TaxID=2943436 RepID=UPI002445C888|nr:smad nuclear-interacting protein 1-like [Paramacrobiotus metropolitanus]
MPSSPKHNRGKDGNEVRRRNLDADRRRSPEERFAKRRRSQSPSTSAHDRPRNSQTERTQRRHASREPSDSHSRRDDSHRERDRRHRNTDQPDQRRNSSDHRQQNRERHGCEGRPARDQRERDRNNSRPSTDAQDVQTGYGRQADSPPPEPNAANVKTEKPNFGLSGKLLEDTNTVNGVVIQYSQPDEARKPKVRWRLYPFKGDSSLPTMYIHRQSAYLLGRDRRVVDIPIDHPSCSKQHAVIQYRLIPAEKEDGTVVRRVKPYIIDLGSANGTSVNGKRIEAQRFVELLEKDVIKFGFSSREYVMLHEGSKDDEYHSDDEDGNKSS